MKLVVILLVTVLSVGAEVSTTTAFPKFHEDVLLLVENVIYSFAELLNDFILGLVGYDVQYFNTAANITSDALIFGNAQIERLQRLADQLLDTVSGKNGKLSTILSETLDLAEVAIQNITGNVNKVRDIADNNVHLTETLQKIQNFTSILY